MSTYHSNSHKSREGSIPEKKVEKIIKGDVKRKKKSEIKKFSEIFIADDATNVKSYIFMDIVVPAIKSAITDVIITSVHMILGTGSTNKKSPSSKFSYWDGVNNSKSRSTLPTTNRSVSSYDYDEIIFDNRAEADEVLVRLDEMIDVYGVVSINDLYDLVGITGNYTDNKYGWTDLRNARPDRVRDGYVLSLPKASPLR